MKLNIAVFTLLLFQISFAHKDKSIQKTYGNVQLLTYASDYVEEMNKTLIIGQYAEMLAKKYSFSNKIYLYFLEEQHGATSIKAWLPDASENSDNLDGINVSFRMKEYNIEGCLKVIENAILNRNKLKSFAAKQEAIYHGHPSAKIAEILKMRIDRPNEIKELGKPLYSYFFQNNKYHLVLKEDDKEVEISTVNNVLDYQVLSRDMVIVFTSFDELKIFQAKVSARTEHIDSIPNFYWPYNAHLSGNNKILIEFFPRSEQKNRVMIYYLDKNIFIQDLDKELEKE